MTGSWRKPMLGGLLIFAGLTSLAYGSWTYWPTKETKIVVAIARPVVHVAPPAVEEPVDPPEIEPERLFDRAKVRSANARSIEDEYAVDARANNYAPAGPVVSSKKQTPKGTSHERQNALLARMIKVLHQETHQQFEQQPDFGRARVPFVMKKVQPRVWTMPEWTSEELYRGAQDSVFGASDLSVIHRFNLNTYILANGKLAEDAKPIELTKGNHITEHRWEIKTLQLVGIAMHESPVVYVSDNGPKMGDLSATPTRELDVFEAEGLEELMSGKDLYIRAKQGTVRVLGPVQANKTCMKCHTDAKEGDMLGAFSYTLRPASHGSSAEYDELRHRMETLRPNGR